ncbi:MAG: hypothetical protein IJE50_06050 [Clostridia bacterium]|nr:hypothetical protein [Clostridia bacterium]
MKKTLWIYIAIWAFCLALFNVLAFLVPALPDYPKFTATFWIGYALTTVAYIANLIASINFLSGSQSKDAEKRFYRMPLIQKGLTSLIVMTVIGSICVAISAIPTFIGAILCIGVVVFHIISVLKTSVAIAEVERVGENVKQKTQFIKLLTVDASTLDSRASSEAKALTHKVYEAIRYADPMSHDALADVESELKIAFENFAKAIDSNDIIEAESLAHTVLALVSERNAKCKALK